MLAAKLGTIAVATHSATLSVFYCSCALVYGLSAALAVRVARHLGAGTPARARAVSKYGVVISFVLGGLICLVYIFFRNLSKLYSSDPLVWEQSRRIQLVVGFAFLSMSLYYATLASLNGQARPINVAVSFFIGAWCIGVPLCYVLAFVADLGLLGLWIGTMCSQTAVTAVMGISVLSSGASTTVMRKTDAHDNLFGNDLFYQCVLCCLLSHPIFVYVSCSFDTAHEDWEELTLLAAEKAEAKTRTIALASSEFEEAGMGDTEFGDEAIEALEGELSAEHLNASFGNGGVNNGNSSAAIVKVTTQGSAAAPANASGRNTGRRRSGDSSNSGSSGDNWQNRGGMSFKAISIAGSVSSNHGTSALDNVESNANAAGDPAGNNKNGHKSSLKNAKIDDANGNAKSKNGRVMFAIAPGSFVTSSSVPVLADNTGDTTSKSTPESGSVSGDSAGTSRNLSNVTADMGFVPQSAAIARGKNADNAQR